MMKTETDSAVDRDHLATFHAAYVRVPLGEAAPCEDDQRPTQEKYRPAHEVQASPSSLADNAASLRTPYWQTTQRRCAVARLRTPGRAARPGVACRGLPQQPAGPARGSMQTRPPARPL